MGFRVWHGETPLTLMNGTTYTAEQIRGMYPITAAGASLLEVNDSGWVGGIESLNDCAERHGILPELSESEKFEQCVYEMTRNRDPNYDSLNDILESIMDGMAAGLA
jgi:hypothetical protein